MKHFILFLMILSLAACRPNNDSDSDSNHPEDADEVIELGIMYARYGEEWWSIQDGEQWNEITSFTTAVLVPEEGEQISMEDFGSYYIYIEQITDSTVIFASDVQKTIFLNALIASWNTEKYVEIQLPCYDGTNCGTQTE
ncbi:MAG: hypothetical protein WD059_00665 [Balneolaceae bacterium]